MNTDQCAAMIEQALTASVQEVALVYLISLLSILLTAYLCRSNRTAGREPPKWQPYLHSARQLTDKKL